MPDHLRSEEISLNSRDKLNAFSEGKAFIRFSNTLCIYINDFRLSLLKL